MGKKTVGLTALFCCGLLGGVVALAEEAVHTVRRGDTLWEISGIYLKEPKAWPKVWKENPAIRNPHLILPGQVVRLPARAGEQGGTEASLAPAAMPAVDRSGPPLALTVLRDEPAAAGKTAAADAVVIRHTRGVGRITRELPDAGTVLVTPTSWSSETRGGVIFVQAASARVGAVYGVYRDLGKVDPPGFFKASPGRLLAEIGTVEIIALEEARQLAKITTSHDMVRQGDLLGPPLPEQPAVTVRNRTAPLSATVVALERNRLIAGSGDIVYLDAGSEQGLVPGDRLRVSGGKDEGTQRVSAFVAVLTTTPTTAAALVLSESDHQVVVGDSAGPAL